MHHNDRNASQQADWRRVSRENPCPVCGKPDWCSVALDGSVATCQRVEAGAVKYLGEAGWLHRLREDERRRPGGHAEFKIRLSPPTAASHDMLDLAEGFRQAVDPGRLDRLAKHLGLSADSLSRLSIGWSDESRAWSFPMVDARGMVVGIRLRTEEGRKFAVPGGHEGLLVPVGLSETGPLVLPEGPTDTAAFLDWGFDAIGRPNNIGGKKELVALVRRLRPVEVVVVADNDDPGRDGAMALVQRLAIYVPRLRILAPPPGIKDARAWKQAGASREVVVQAILGAEVHRVSMRAGEVHYGR